MTSRLSFFLFLVSVAACSGSTTVTGPSSSSSSSGTAITPGTSEPVVLPDGTTVPTVTCGDESSVSAAGTWDVIQSINDTTGTGALTITDDTFSFSTNPVSLSFTKTATSMALTWTDPKDSNGPVVLTTTQTPAALDLGIVPLALGGSWSFSGDKPTDGCGATLGDGTFTSTCTNAYTGRFGRLDGRVIGTRTNQKASVFGSLGGSWHLTGSNGDGTVDATFSANVFTAVIIGRAAPVGNNGWVTLKICNGKATGQSSDGAELAATRR